MKVLSNGIKYYGNVRHGNEEDGRFATILSSFLQLSLALGLIENNSSETTENSLDTNIKPIIHKFSFFNISYLLQRLKNSFTGLPWWPSG